MLPHLRFTTAALIAALPLSFAQTYTSCNPLQKTCPPDKGLASSTFYSDFTTGDSSLADWEITAGTVTTGPDGAEFTIWKEGDAPTIKTPFYFFFGKYEVVMKTSGGTGIVSSVVLESDDLDEVDWEGLGSFNYEIETNYFGKGDTSTYNRATYVNVPTPANDYHTYTVDWQTDHISWYVDGNLVRTLLYNDAEGGSRFPQTPMNLRIGIWAGGDPRNGKGTIEWAGGETNYGLAPFTMYIKSVHIENQNPADSYTYGDHSGSWQSIQFNKLGPDPDQSSSTTTTTTTTSVASSTTDIPATTSIVSTTIATTSSYSTSTAGSTSVATTIATTSTVPAQTPFTTSTSGPSGVIPGSDSNTSATPSSEGSSSSDPGSEPSSSSRARSSSRPGSNSSSGSKIVSDVSSSTSLTLPVSTGAASTLSGMSLAFVGAVAALLQL